MLRGLKERYARHHDVHVTDAAVVAAVQLSRRYLTGRQLPDKAVDLLDTAAARVRMSQDATPIALARCEAERAALETEACRAGAGRGRHGIRDAARIGAIDSRLEALDDDSPEVHADTRRPEGRDGNPVRPAPPMAGRGRGGAARTSRPRSKPPTAPWASAGRAR